LKEAFLAVKEKEEIVRMLEEREEEGRRVEEGLRRELREGERERRGVEGEVGRGVEALRKVGVMLESANYEKEQVENKYN
jgi:hypothetical protein